MDCPSTVLHAKGRCSPCYWKAKREATMQNCPSCGLRRVLRQEQGLCGMCVRRRKPPKVPAPRTCTGCGRLAKHVGHGLCSACYQKEPCSVPTWAHGAQDRLGDCIPDWFGLLAEDLAERCAPGVAIRHLHRVENILRRGPLSPGELVAVLRSCGRSPGATTRLVNGFFTRNGQGDHLADESERRSERRRHRRILRSPVPLRRAVEAFASYLVASRARATLLGGRGLRDATIEVRIADISALAIDLERRGILDWAHVATADIENFLREQSRTRLAACRMFFAFARQRKLILIDPTKGINRARPRGFTGRTLDTAQQHRLLGRWQRTDIDPRERVVGLLALLHGATSTQIRSIMRADVDLKAPSLRIADRTYPVPLDPLTAAALESLLTLRDGLRTDNPHLILTKDSRMHDTAASPYFMTHILDAAETTPRLLRETRIADLAHTLDPRLVAAALGLTHGGALHYVNGSTGREEQLSSPNL